MLAKKKKIQIITIELERLFPEAKIMLHYSNPWELLVAVMLSAQCTDKMVNKVTERLFKRYPTFNDYLQANIEEFEKDIHSTGFYRMKAKHILETARIIHVRFHDTVPDRMEELITLPGVGRKTANVVLSNVFGKSEGIAVDTHVKRLTRLWGLTQETDPGKIERDLMRLLPREEWKQFTYRVIEYGRAYCIAKKHDHEKCPLTKILKRKEGK